MSGATRPMRRRRVWRLSSKLASVTQQICQLLIGEGGGIAMAALGVVLGEDLLQGRCPAVVEVRRAVVDAAEVWDVQHLSGRRRADPLFEAHPAVEGAG